MVIGSSKFRSQVADSMYLVPASLKLWPIAAVDHGDFRARKSQPVSVTMPAEQLKIYSIVLRRLAVHACK